MLIVTITNEGASPPSNRGRGFEVSKEVSENNEVTKFKTDSLEKVANWLLNSNLINWGEYIDKNNKLLPKAITKALEGGKETIITGDYIIKIYGDVDLIIEIYLKLDSIKQKLPVFKQNIKIDVVDIGSVTQL